MASTPPIYERIRTALADAYRAVEWQTSQDKCLRVYELNGYVATSVDAPCIVVSFDLGTEQVRGGTNAEDDIGYPFLCGYYVSAPINDVTQGGGPTAAEFRDVSRALFLNKLLPAVDDVWQLEFLGQPNVLKEQPGFEQLMAAVGIVAVARVPRIPTGSN